MKKRNIGIMIFLIFITLGIYVLYWLVDTKEDLNKLGARLPTAWLIIIPLANFYFIYKFAEAFSIFILKEERINTVFYFFLLAFLLPVGEIICQVNINEIIENYN